MTCCKSRFNSARSRSALAGKCRNTVPIATPARRATSSVEACGPRSANPSSAARRMRRRLRSASARSGRSGPLDKMSHHSLSYVPESSLILRSFGAMPSTPRLLFQQMQQRWFGPVAALTGDLLADDVIIENPFASPGPHRIEGRQQFLDFAKPRRATFPVRFDACRTIAIHDTTDPATIVVEYELTGTSTTTGRQATARFIG